MKVTAFFVGPVQLSYFWETVVMNKTTERYSKEDLQEAVRVMREGGIILYPTDTVWGIGCDATNAEAVERIYRLKKRADAKAMLCLLDAPGKIQGYVTQVPAIAWDLLACEDNSDSEMDDVEAPQPLTIIYPGAKNVAPNLLAEDGSLGIRITQEPFSKALCAQLRHPVVSTSANLSGSPAARTFDEITDEILSGVDYICHFRRNDRTPSKPSGIIKLGLNNEVQVIRK